jgi:hypothetical protein
MLPATGAGRREADTTGQVIAAVRLHEMQQISHARLGRLLFCVRANVLSAPGHDEVPLRAQLAA